MRATILVLALLGAGPVLAQTSPPDTAHASRHLDNLATLLDLTDAQKGQVQTILQEQHAKVRASMEQARASGSKPDWQQMKASHEQIHQETVQKLTLVLSAEQLKKFEIIAAEMHGHFHHPGMNGPAGAPDGAPPPPAQN